MLTERDLGATWLVTGAISGLPEIQVHHVVRSTIYINRLDRNEGASCADLPDTPYPIDIF